MANEPSFFQRLTGSLRQNDESMKPKRVDFSIPTEPIATEEPAALPSAMPAATPASVPPTDEPSAPQEKSAGAPAEKHEQWMAEAQEGQLTIDVYQTDADIVIKSTVAGVKPEELDIAITNDMVTIRGKRERDEEVSQDRYFYQECYWGPFSRTVILPADVASEEAEATIHNGILTIRLPKVEKEQTKKIKVKPIP